MSNLIPDPADSNDSQIAPTNGDNPDLYFQQLIAQQQSNLTPTTDLEEYKKRLEIIQRAIDLSQKKTEIDLKTAQDAISLEIARIELSDRRLRSTEVKFKIIFKIVITPIFIITGAYIWYRSDSILGSALLFLGVRLALSNEDVAKSIDTLKNLLSNNTQSN
jgi:hypothetical protein